MKSKLALSITCLSLMLSSPALATDSSIDCGKGEGKWITQEEAQDKASALGYDVRKVKVENGCYEIYAISSEDKKVEIFMNPVSGEVVTVKDK